jgi:flagellar basal-body rod modification protein FlgD
MTIASVTSAATSTSSTSSASVQLSTNFNTFLTMLTAQLRNQDPTAPMDANAFTQQLVQYSQVEQQLSTNSKLDKLLAAQAGSQTTAALGYLGRNVTFDASLQNATSAGATWTFQAPASGEYTLRVRDSSGTLVKETAGSIQSGVTSSYTWNGVRSDGQATGTGVYSLELVNSSGSVVSVKNSGSVTGVDSSSGTTTVTVGGQAVPIANITGITA